MNAFINLLLLLIFDAIVACVILAGLLLIAGVKPATYAVIRRNFVGYFSSPTGYVFIGVFMFLSSVAAFWPQAFFNENLATLYQLNLWFAPVMLIFVPAITMSIWAEERHEGTDELLLTMPASDVDIVLGKFIAAALIFTMALFFSQVANYRVLIALSKGELDLGLFLATYAGYWLMGLAMIAIGMTASFFTSNLTVGYILGALFNAPFVFLMFVDRLVPGRALAQTLASWSLSSRFRDFGRGVLSLSSTFFFLMLIAVGIYASLVLIARRHWMGGKDGRSMLGHYVLRTISLLAIAFGATSFLTQHDRVRADLTVGRLSSLAPETIKLLKELPNDRPVLIEAYIGSGVPEAYVETRVNLLNTLQELDAAGGSQIRVEIHDNLRPFTDEAAQADRKYGIKPQMVYTSSRGRYEDEKFILGAAVSSGLERVVIPFFGRGIPAEYELARSIKTVAGAKRKRLGVINTDAKMFGGFDMARMASQPKQRIIQELEKQYDVDQVDPSSPIDENRYDVLLLVQPSTLSPPQLAHVIGAIRNGIPTAIFEDPRPYVMSHVPGTSDPRMPQGNPMFGGGPPPEPKCDLTQLWDVLGIEMVGEPSTYGDGFDAHVVYQDYNPYPMLAVGAITKEWVFVSPEAPGADDEALNIHDEITSGLKEVLCLYPGAIRNLGAKGLEFTPLMKTSDVSGWVRTEDLRNYERDLRALERAENASGKKYVLAARVKGFLKEPLGMSTAQVPESNPSSSTPDEDSSSGPSAVPEPPSTDDRQDERRKEIHVIYATDIDLMASEFLAIREQIDDETNVNWRFENVVFMLNAIDSLVGEHDLIAIRKRKARHSTLKRIDDETEEARRKSKEEVSKKKQEFDEALEREQAVVDKGYAEFRDKVNSLKEKYTQGDQSVYQELQTAATRLTMLQTLGEQRVSVKKESLQRDLERFQEQVRHEMQRNVEKVQLRYKLDAIWPALVLPLVVGLGVWLVRAQKEHEGVAPTRRR